MKGERVWDEYKKEHFKLKALLFVTITDLPGLGSLSGQVTRVTKDAWFAWMALSLNF
jgi:hypothetical protein